MKTIIYSYRSASLAVLTLMIGLFVGCTPDEEDYALGLKAEAAFKVTDISTEEMKNTYLVESTTDTFLYHWDFGNGVVKEGSKIDTAYYENKGTYTIKLTTSSAGGQSTFEQTITVEEDAVPQGENIVKGSDMEDPSAWTIYNIGLDLTTVEFSNGELKVSNEGGSSNVGIWQAIEVEAGKQYKLSAKVVENSSSNGAWIEFNIGKTKPVEGDDHTDGKTPLGGIVSFEESGTVYIVIKAGSWDGNLATTIIDDVELREILGPPLVEGDNVVEGSDMASDEFWTIFNPGGGVQADTEFTSEGLKFSNSTTEDSNAGVWQAVEVNAGQQYKFSANVKGSGAEDSWFVVYLGKSKPVNGEDYNKEEDGGNDGYIGLNTWAGCGSEEFDGNITSVGCVGSGNGARGMVEFEESGTVYIVIKTGSVGGGSLGTDGITISDIKLVEMN